MCINGHQNMEDEEFFSGGGPQTPHIITGPAVYGLFVAPCLEKSQCPPWITIKHGSEIVR